MQTGTLEQLKSAIATALPTPLRTVIRRSLRTFVSPAQAFRKAYVRNDWGSCESVSGPGSEMSATATVRTELPHLLRELGARSLLDAPCGDFHWMKEARLDLDRYIGIDVVPEVIERARQHQAANRTFAVLDITSAVPPQADVILCRDCLVHLPFSLIRASLRNFKRSGASYLITTTFPGIDLQNTDIAIGDWRPLDLQCAPFNFPKPLRTISENNAFVAEKSLGVWHLDTINP